MLNEESTEYTLLLDYLLFPQLTASVQRSLDALERKPNVLNRAYTASGAYLIHKITEDLRENRLALNRAGLRVLRTTQTDSAVFAEFKRRGQAAPEVFTVDIDVLREEKRARMARYLTEFGETMEEAAGYNAPPTNK